MFDVGRLKLEVAFLCVATDALFMQLFRYKRNNVIHQVAIMFTGSMPAYKGIIVDLLTNCVFDCKQRHLAVINLEPFKQNPPRVQLIKPVSLLIGSLTVSSNYRFQLCVYFFDFLFVVIQSINLVTIVLTEIMIDR